MFKRDNLLGSVIKSIFLSISIESCVTLNFQNGLESGVEMNVGELISSYFIDTTQNGQSNEDLCAVILPLPNQFLGKLASPLTLVMTFLLTYKNHLVMVFG